MAIASIQVSAGCLCCGRFPRTLRLHRVPLLGVPTPERAFLLFATEPAFEGCRGRAPVACGPARCAARGRRLRGGGGRLPGNDNASVRLLSAVALWSLVRRLLGRGGAGNARDTSGRRSSPTGLPGGPSDATVLMAPAAPSATSTVCAHANVIAERGTRSPAPTQPGCLGGHRTGVCARRSPPPYPRRSRQPIGACAAASRETWTWCCLRPAIPLDC